MHLLVRGGEYDKLRYCFRMRGAHCRRAGLRDSRVKKLGRNHMQGRLHHKYSSDSYVWKLFCVPQPYEAYGQAISGL